MSDRSRSTTESPTTRGDGENGNGGNESRRDVDAEEPSNTESFEKEFQKMTMDKKDTLDEQSFMTDIQEAPATTSECSGESNLLAPVVQGRDMLVERNKHQPPLLKLPAELRMKIWGFVTGGQVIHLEFHHYLPFRFREREVYRRWPLCWINSTKTYFDPFKMLRLVCRQIRAEAHIAPYENNIFHFTSFIVFKGFVNGISKAQVEAVREISLGDPLGFRRCNFYDEWRDTPPESRKGVANILPPNLKRIFLGPKGEIDDSLRRKRDKKSLPYDIKEVRDLLGLDADQGPLGITVLVLNVMDRKQGIDNARQVFDI